MRTSLLVLSGSTLYATARYNVLKGVAWSDWPTYTFNKALALAALLLLLLAVTRRVSARAPGDGWLLPMASSFGLAHVLLSLVLLSPAYYEKFFVLGKLTASAGLSMTLGVIAAAVMAMGRGKRLADHVAGADPLRLALLAFVVGLHAALQGFDGWSQPAEWPGGLPPITLISFLVGSAALVVARQRQRRPPQVGTEQP